MLDGCNEMGDGMAGGEEQDRARSMESANVPMPVWARLYRLADCFKKLAPWKWIPEDLFFGVQPRQSKDVWLVSFVGLNDNYLACAAYLGWQAFRDMLAMQSPGSRTEVSIAEIPHLQAIFTSRRFVDPHERELIRALGLRYRGKKDWPLFRSFRPGYLPWPLTAEEADTLATVLEQALGVTLRAEEDPSLLACDDDEILLRVEDRDGWRDEVRAVPALPATDLTVGMDAKVVSSLQKGRRLPAAVEVDLVLTSGSIQPAHNTRPQSMYALAVVDAETGKAYGVEVLQALRGVPAMWAEVPDRVLAVWRQMGGVPRQVEVRSDRMMNVLRPLTEMLPFRLTMRERLPHTGELMSGLDAFLSRRRGS